MNIRRCFFSGIQKIMEYSCKRSADDSVILMFHQVSDDKNSWLDGSYAITKTGFERLITCIQSSDYALESLDDLNTKSKKSIYITFDDVFEDAFLNAIPYLKEKGIPFAVFVATELLGKPRYITKEQLMLLSKEPLCTMGFHTKSHKIMRKMSDEVARAEADKEGLEKIIGKEISYFAYPYGSVYAVSKRNIRIVNQLGYKNAFSTLKMAVNGKRLQKCKGFVPRVNINEDNYKNII